MAIFSFSGCVRRTLVCGAAVALLLLSVVEALPCRPDRFRNGTGNSRSGCPKPPHGNYYNLGRTILQNLVPAMKNFTSLDYSSGADTDEKIAFRDYMRARLQPYLSPFYDFQCRCDDSCLPPAASLRNAFINNGYIYMRDYSRDHKNITNIQNLQSWITANFETIKAMRCTPTLSDAQSGRSYKSLLPNQTCVWTFRRTGKNVNTNTVRCNPGFCPNQANLF